MSAPWFRVPEWCALADDPAEVTAAVWLLGRWHLGREPSVADLKRTMTWGWDRSSTFAARLWTWAGEAGARRPDALPGKSGSNRGGSVAKPGRLEVAAIDIVEPDRGAIGEAPGSNRGASHERVLLPERDTDQQTEAAPAAGSANPEAAPDAKPSLDVDPPRNGDRRGDRDPRGTAKPDDEATLYAAYRGARPRVPATPTPDSRKHIRRILTECGGLEQAGLYLGWTFQSQDERARQVRGEAPWPGGKVNAMTSLEELGRHVGSRMPMAEAWESRGRGAGVGPSAASAPPTDDVQRAWEWVCGFVRSATPGQRPAESTVPWQARARAALRRVPNGWQRVLTADDFNRRALREEFVSRWSETPASATPAQNGGPGSTEAAPHPTTAPVAPPERAERAPANAMREPGTPPQLRLMGAR
jgi:hypothetical protein